MKVRIVKSIDGHGRTVEFDRDGSHVPELDHEDRRALENCHEDRSAEEFDHEDDQMDYSVYR